MAEKQATPELKQYHGSCHCGNFKFSVKLAPLEKVAACNCSLCVKIGYLWVFPAKNDHFTVEKGEGSLKDYEFGPKTLAHKFCPVCGSSVMGLRHNVPDGQALALNACMLEDVDLSKLTIDSFDGSSLGSPYKAPKPPTKPDAKDGQKVYEGSCHCGAVTYTVQNDPITTVRSCDCSICRRNNYRWIYPPKEAVTIHGKDTLTSYRFNTKKSSHMFCPTCGVSIFNIPEGDFPLLPINVRTLNGVDVEAMEVKTEPDPEMMEAIGKWLKGAEGA